MKHRVKLILPNRKYVISYLKGNKELQKEKHQIGASGMELFKTPEDFSLYKQRLEWNRKGIKLRKGWVPSTLYWAIVGNKFVGRLTIRHRLNKYLRTMGGNIGYVVIPSKRRKGYATDMLRQGLKKAKLIGIKKVMVSCNENNIASKKVIEKNGGMLENKVKKEGIWKLRFWVPLK